MLTSNRFKSNKQLQSAARNRPPLNGGAKGDGVRLVQQALVELGFSLPVSYKKFGSPDGVYGSETKGVIRDFQRGESLGVDGIAGKNTMSRLDELLPFPGDPLPALPGVKLTHQIRLHFFSIASPVVPEFQALRNAQRVYRQYGIDLRFVSGQSLNIDPSTAVVLDNVNVGTCLIGGPTTGEQDKLFGLASPIGIGKNDISVFYVNKATKSNGSKLAGCATHKGPAAVLVAAVGSRWTMGHEIGHVLLGKTFTPSHSGDSKNLMFAPTSGITANPPILTEAQVEQMKKSKHCIEI